MKKEIAIIGLGKMGGNLALNMIDHGWRVIGYNRSREKTDALVEKSEGVLVPAYSYKEVVDSFSDEGSKGSRYIWLMLPAGDLVDDVIREISMFLLDEDMIIDGGNGFYKDAIRRAARLRKKGLRFMDVGVSGGPDGARDGACMMIGGQRENFTELEGLFKAVTVEGGYAFFNGDGAGHFVKMVHNGIEYGMMEAIAEGFALMESCGETMTECVYNLDLKDVARVYNHGSVIESRLISWLQDAFQEWGSDLEPVHGAANQLGEGRWAAEVAEAMGVDHGVLDDAIKSREYSQQVPSFGGKLIQAMRGQFGRHPILNHQKATKSGKKASGGWSSPEDDPPHRPDTLRTKIFLDSGDPADTRRVLDALGFLDGQTTNPALVAKNPHVQECLIKDGKCSKDQVHDFYKEIVQDIAKLIPDGDISVEVYADIQTTSSHMLHEGEEMCGWAPKARVKFPTNVAGLEAASRAIHEGIRTNMTLIFQQEQAAAVYSATAGCAKGDVVISPFIGRLDDRGENGMDLISNIMQMYQDGDEHVGVLTASVRSVDHLLGAIAAGTDIVTASTNVLTEWAEKGMPLPDADYEYPAGTLKAIPYKDLDLSAEWHSYEFTDSLINSGIVGFAEKWNALIGSEGNKKLAE